MDDNSLASLPLVSQPNQNLLSAMVPQVAPPQQQPAAPQQQSKPPKPGLPNLVQLIGGLINPSNPSFNPNAQGGSGKRLDVFENFLGNFVQALGAGLANSGHGPGANARGAGAAIQAPYQNAITQWQLGQEQQKNDSENQLRQAQSSSLNDGQFVQTANGPMWVSKKDSGKVAGAEISAQGRVDAANVTAKGRISAEQVKVNAEMGNISKVEDAVDANGNVVKRAYDKKGNVLGDLPGALPSASYLPKTTATTELKQQDDGSFVYVPKTTTTSPVLPGKTGGAPRVPRQAGGVRAVNGPDGEPLKGPATSTTRTMREAAPKVLDFVDRIRTLVQEQQKTLGPSASRWSELWAGKVGAPNPEFTKLRTNAGLLQTLLMRMHVGARGSEYMMKHFADLFDYSKQSPENMLAALGEIETYAKDVRGNAPTSRIPQSHFGGAPSGASAEVHDASGKLIGHVVNNKFVAIQ